MSIITYTDSYKLKHNMKPGLKGSTSGYPATVVRPYTPGMVEVRTPGGVSCIPNEDFIPEITIEDAFAAVAPIFHNAGVDVHLVRVGLTKPVIMFQLEEWDPSPAADRAHLAELSAIMATVDSFVQNFMPTYRARYCTVMYMLYAYIEEVK